MTRMPNILFLMADQMQAQVLDSDHICQTLHLDNLAHRGVRFVNAHTVNAICSPTRASLMTGLMPHNHGVLEVLYGKVPDLHVLRADRPHWAQRLVEAGYRTGYFGKWHIERDCRPDRFGWQVDGGHWLRRPSNALEQGLLCEILGDEPLQPPCDPSLYLEEPEGYGAHLLYGVTDRLAERRPMGLTTSLALRFLEDAVQQTVPWCCFVSFQEPHDPYITHRRWFEHYMAVDPPEPPNAHDDMLDKPGLYRRAQGIWRQVSTDQRKAARACYYGSISEIDTQFGRLLDFLQTANVEGETIVVMTSDHGDLLGAHGLFFKDFSAFEEVYRIPFIVAGPNARLGAGCQARVGIHDLCPTLLKLAGCEPFSVSDGRSLVDLLESPDQVSPDWRQGYAEYFGNRHRLTQRVVWDGPWKFVFNGFDCDELYHLKDDPGELHNLAADPTYEEQVRHMMRLYWRYAHATGDTPLTETFYPALRLGVVGPQSADDAPDLVSP